MEKPSRVKALTIKETSCFLTLAYLTALFFETIANTLGDGTLFQQPKAIPFFISWYGGWYLLSYLTLRFQLLWVIALVFAIIGTILEIVFFRRCNPFIDPLIYAIMGASPFFLLRKIFRN